MVNKIKIWQIVENELIPLNKTMKEEGRTEVNDLENWIRKTPEILGEELLIIGEQIVTKNGPLDFLAIDKNGNLVIIELKRDEVPREALGQAIDYASDIASWSLQEIDATCRNFTRMYLEDYIRNNFPISNLKWEDISINQFQRILFVGTSIDESLQRMIEWLSKMFGVSINFITFAYGKNINDDEYIATTSIISDELEKERSQQHQKKIPIYDVKERLRNFSENIGILFHKLDEKVKTISDKIYYKVNKGNSVTYYSPDRLFTHVIFQKQGLKLHLFTRGEEINEVENFGYARGGSKWGKILLKKTDEIGKIFLVVKRSHNLIVDAIKNNEKTSWFSETEESDDGDLEEP